MPSQDAGYLLLKGPVIMWRKGAILLSLLVIVACLLVSCSSNGGGRVVYEVEFTPSLFPFITFIVSSEGVSIEPNSGGIVTPIGTFAFEPDVQLVAFEHEPLVVIVQNDDWPENRRYEVFHLDHSEDEIEMLLNDDAVNGLKIRISQDGLFIAEVEAEQPFITYDGRTLWIDATGGKIAEFSQRGSGSSRTKCLRGMWDGDYRWNGSYRPWQYVEDAVDKDAGALRLIMTAFADLMTMAVTVIPQMSICAFNSVAIGKVVGLFTDSAVVIGMTWLIIKNPKPMVYIGISFLLILVLFVIARVMPFLL